MRKPIIGLIVGGVLGLLDGLSAWLSPEARTMMMPIVLGSTIKGLLTGLGAGFIARRWHSMPVGIAAGVVIGLVLSTIAALGQPDHFSEIVLPGMLVGALTGVATQRVRTAALALAVCAATLVSAQPSAPVTLSPLDQMIGNWQGPQEGQPGNGTVERSYARILNSRFIEARNRSVYAAQEKNPKGETHEDIGFYSVDRARKTIVFRQLHVEGFVIHYAMQPVTTPGTLVFLSEAIENIPAGYRARETYTMIGRDEFEELFEMAEPGKDFEPYSRARLKRVK